MDDSALMRHLLTSILSSDPAIEVVGSANDPFIAREKIKALQPDVITLDVEMPRMDGLTFLEKLMRAHPMPVVMLSSLTERGCEITLRALSLGAVDFITKPNLDLQNGTIALAEEIVNKVKAAAGARLNIRPTLSKASAPLNSAALSSVKTTHKIVAVGSSTGGTEALKELLTALPADFPGLVLVQHMPENFTKQFAQRLDGLCRIRVHEATDGDRILPGHALVAPGGRHMEVVRRGAEYTVRVFDGERVNRHRPSVDVLFHSCAQQVGRNAIGIILTGMGSDGAKGLQAMRQAGAFTVAQDESTCVVFGMPKEAIALGAAQEIQPLHEIAPTVLKFLQ